MVISTYDNKVPQAHEPLNVLALSGPVKGLLEGQLVAQEHHQGRTHKQTPNQQQRENNMIHQLEYVVGDRDAQ